MPFIETNREFHLRHGEECVEIEGITVYRDGATLQSDRGGLGERREPPDDPHERAMIVLSYWKERVRLALNDFIGARELLNSLAKNAIRDGYPPPPRSEIERLKELQGIVRRFQKKLAAAQKEVEATAPRFGGQAAYEARKRACRTAGERFLGELGEIKL